ncbi:hypothetical protein GQ44DRAFT_827220 [Phaeosphaeriaceae sp. PMI808]|nr:hypothetical protein GQ44DRAFT_827220 [Phaeosphaeriaceae sp. PMI808]
MPPLSLAETLYLFHHIVLPPKLPQADDWKVEYEEVLLDTVVEALRTFSETARDDQPQISGQINHLVSTVRNLCRVRNDSGTVSDSQLAKLLHGLVSGETTGAIPIEIKAQNAAVVVSKQAESDIIFEVFELSPPNETVMKTKGRLKRSFPTYACQISLKQFQDEGLIESIAHTLGKMSCEEAPGFQPQTRKNKKDHDETRDTTHPGMITDFFMHLLSVVGQPTDVQGVWKNTREDVLWSNSYMPWRRSPLWLLVRTTMQLQFARISSAELYKVAMVNVLARVLQSVEMHRDLMSTEMLYITSAKLTGRLQKLRKLIPESSISLYTRSSLILLEDAQSRTRARVERFTNRVDNDIDMGMLADVHPRNDLDIHFPGVDKFIEKISLRKRQSTTSDFEPSTKCPAFSEHTLPAKFNGSGEYAYFYLASVEKWVEDHLSSWLERHISGSTTCKRLRQLLEEYYRRANSTYSALTNIPGSLSTMYLTILELWIACDKCACKMYPLLREFDPEVELSSFRSLSIPFKRQLERLSTAEDYVQSRQTNARAGAPSLYRDFGHSASFAVEFFDGSSEHQSLRSDIEQHATSKRQEKCQELAKQKQLYRDLTAEADGRSCDYTSFYKSRSQTWGSRHARWCEKCKLRSQAEKLQIRVHEWPLSSDQAIAKATVFEFKIPVSYSHWRDVTMFVLTEVLSFTYADARRPSATYILDGQDGLSSSWESPSDQRITILSEVKPLTGSHYRVKRDISFLLEDDVCVANALRYEYFDCTEKAFTTVLRCTQNVSKKCTYQLPFRSMELQDYLRTPTTLDNITPNQVMASLSDCPPHFSLDEYKAFGSIPIGFKIQYQNILVQLAMPTVDLAKAETQCLILQTIHRAGPQSSKRVERTAHKILSEDSFCQALINKIEVALKQVSENWETWRAVATLVQLALRMLSVNTSKQITTKCLELLEIARQISLKWLNDLRERLPTAVDDSQRKEISSRLTEISLLCTSTFDTDSLWLEVILRSSSAISVLLQASIVVQENKDVTSSEHENLYRAMLQSWRLLLFRSFPVLSKHMSSLNVQKGLNQAVVASWAAFHPTGHWGALEEPFHQWIYVKCDALVVHFNMLTAELLVKGLPLSRLPQQYMAHPLYSSLFEKSPIEVMPTNEPGMEFSAKHTFHPRWLYNLSFGMEGSDLLVLAERDGMRFDLVPSHVFQDRLPTIFIDNYFHWYDHSTGEVEFRLRDDPWSSISNLWRLKRCGASWRLVNEQKSLINPSSNTGRTISKLLSPIELELNVHLIFDNSQVVLIQLPRRRLGFRYTPGESNMYSHQYQGMVVDTDQGIGTLFGLTNKLILKHERGSEDRLVLIPEGSVNYSTTIDHTSVSIELDSACTTHAYQVDELLGRMIDNGSLQSKLFLCYLHALTSTCFPDALTGLTGTESALSILRSAAVLSFDVLTARNMDILENIAHLTPGREFYPAHMQVMQQVRWDKNLPSMSQHPGFHTAVEEIFRIARRMTLLQPVDVSFKTPRLDFVQPCLLQRYMLRTSTFRVDGFGAENHTQEFDQNYKPRTRVTDPRRGQRCFVAAEAIFRNQPTLHTSINTQMLQSSLRDVHLHDAIIQGPDRPFDPLELRYDASWLQKPSSFLPDMWSCLHRRLATSPHDFNKYNLMIWLSTAAFAETADMDVIQTLAAFYNCSDLASIHIPSAASLDLSEGDSPTLGMIEGLVQVFRPFNTCPEYNLSRLPDEPNWQWTERKEREFETNQIKASNAFACALHAQWPCAAPTKPRTWSAETYLDTKNAMSKVCSKFKIWYDNRCFYEYLKQVSEILTQQSVLCVETKDNHMVNVRRNYGSANSTSFYGIDNVFNLKAPSSPLGSTSLCWLVPPTPPQLPIDQQTVDDGNNQAKDRLSSLCEKLTGSANSSREKDYISDLQDSCNSLARQEVKSRVSADIPKEELSGLLKTYLKHCERFLKGINPVLRKPVQSGDAIAAQASQLPRISPTFWLGQLHRNRFTSLKKEWKEVVIKYGLAVTELQRARRLVALSSRPHELAEELRNCGHINWSPLEFSETLLLEAESGILVREVQEEIAKQMRFPQNDANSVMQLNMGEGKSSVIVPIIAAFLAQGKLLVRVIVAKPQSRQMFQMLASKLGGLLNRRIYHMPFSRALTLTAFQADSIREIYEECLANGGIMLVQPEHILSFKLMGIECLLNGKPNVGMSLLQTQDFFDTKSRDIVDESDENFSVKFELVYTIGTQRSIELSPERWTIIHSALELVTRYAAKVKGKFPSSIEFDNRWESRYPRTRILRSDAEEMLLDLIAEHICRVGITGLLSVSRQPDAMRQAVLRYIRNSVLTPQHAAEVENGAFWTDATNGALLLLRGLIAGGVLGFALKSKRWRVNYGIDPSRTPKTQLAVPYRSKDSPSPRSEFSHPDVVITLTSLTYYYDGLDDDDLFDTFAHLEKSDQADVEYQAWVRSAALPQAFRNLNGINIKDRHQCTTQIFPLLKYSKGAIDYFLSHIVFPKAMKEFPHKLSASGWDLGAIKSHPTTGFSGTNDSRHILPLSVKYLDSKEQKHTNALVMAYLLQDENSVSLLPPQTDAERLLEIVDKMEPPTRVILDAGAQILELSNIQVAETWLRISNLKHAKAKAVVFFNDNEELSVLDHNGDIELLQTSPFSKHLDECLVYLDQAHTRGTDLKMPKNYRASVTLGANLTKDTLVQACMRLRKLGKGQSVVFCIPEEIQTKILERTSKADSTEVEVSDVLHWAITETWVDIHRNTPLWAMQGRRFEEHKDHFNGAGTTVEQAKMLLEKEAQSLEDRYRPRQRKHFDETNEWDKTNTNIQDILKLCRDFGAMSIDTATLQEEQERELSPEIEEERQVQRPAPMVAEQHAVHEDLVRLIATGIFPTSSDALVPAFKALQSTSAANLYDLLQFPNDLLVTADFMRTVRRPGGVTSESYVSDSYLRPVQWILSVKSRDDKPSASRRLVILCPVEVEQLLPSIRKSNIVTLHLYAPRPTQGYDTLDTLDLYCVGSAFSASDKSIDSSQIVQLNLFAGQLYFETYAEYVNLCRCLGLAWEDPKHGEELQADGFIVPPAGAWGLEKSPVGFLREYMHVRREGESMEKTHLGRVLEGGLLEERDFNRE